MFWDRFGLELLHGLQRYCTGIRKENIKVAVTRGQIRSGTGTKLVRISLTLIRDPADPL